LHPQQSIIAGRTDPVDPASRLGRTGVKPVAEPLWAGHKPLAANLDDARREEFRRDMIAWHETFKGELGFDQPRQYVITYGIRK
jgi:hypothetical protein